MRCTVYSPVLLHSLSDVCQPQDCPDRTSMVLLELGAFFDFALYMYVCVCDNITFISMVTCDPHQMHVS